MKSEDADILLGVAAFACVVSYVGYQSVNSGTEEFRDAYFELAAKSLTGAGFFALILALIGIWNASVPLYLSAIVALVALVTFLYGAKQVLSARSGRRSEEKRLRKQQEREERNRSLRRQRSHVEMTRG